MCLNLTTVYQVPIHNKFSKCPPPELMHSWTRVIADCHTLSKVPRQVKLFGRHQDGVSALSLRCQLELNTSGVLSVPIDKNIKNWGWTNVVLYLEHSLWTYIDITFFVVLVLGITPYVCPYILARPL